MTRGAGSVDLNKQALYRTASVVADGRTLGGIAVPFARPALVSDGGGRPYREAFHRASFTKALKERGGMPFPLKCMHAGAPGYPGDPMPIGPVVFRATPDHLEFEARASKTRAADEALALLTDGIFGAVSIGFHTFRTRAARDAEGPYLERMEATPFELSLAVVGTGLYPDAQVLSVRSAASVDAGVTPRRDELERRLGLLIVP